MSNDVSAIPPLDRFDDAKTDVDRVNSPLQSMVMTFFIIIVSEIGDKTFFIAAVLAMRHPRIVVFLGAFAALLFMTVLSAFLGHIVPVFISKQYTQIIAAALFIVFGVKLLSEAMSISDSQAAEELQQVTVELDAKEKDETMTTENTESDKFIDKKDDGKSKYSAASKSLYQSFSDTIFVQAFVLTFVAEWGDRSQIATVALAGAEDFWWVTIGGLAGHAVCTAMAVIGGRLVASRISVRTVTYAGAFLFFIFGVFGLYEAIFQYRDE